MKYLIKYNEKMDEKEPIDILDDILVYKEKFWNIIDKLSKKNIELILKKLEDENPMMRNDWLIWAVHRDCGGRTYFYGYVKAISAVHAKLRMSIIDNKPYYLLNTDASVISEHSIKKRINEHENEIYKLKNIL
jgi:hypothetical protein